VSRDLVRRLVIAVPTVRGIGAVLFGILASAPGNSFGEPALNPDTPPEGKEVVEAARGLGVPGGQLIVRYVLPKALSPVIVTATLGGGSAILAESPLSLLGPGLPPDMPTWGQLLADARDSPELAPPRALFPGAVIVLGAISSNATGDGLRDALDPRRTLSREPGQLPATSPARQASRAVMDPVSPDPEQGASSTSCAFTA
jgi:hypothetical protein